MKRFLLPSFFAMAVLLDSSLTAAPISLFNGKTLAGWDGDTTNVWRVQDGAIAAGSIQKNAPQNEFLRTKVSYTNFVLRVKVKLMGKEGFVNGGVQVRSQPAKNPPNEMVGYQCDVGEGWWGALYDESRRNKVLIKPNPEDVAKAVRKEEWNEYYIRCEGRRIQTSINGIPMINYTEPDESLPQHGLIGLQIHGGGFTEIFYKDVLLEPLP
jgi:hypothetical protein